jgi:phage N-6-adenine-methyltransferase
MPKQKPGKSRQDYETPQDLIDAIEQRFGPLAFDLAAHAKNTKCKGYYNSRVDSLKQDWSLLKGNLWLNPPFARIGPWAEKCKETVWYWQHLNGEDTFALPFNIFLLTPAAIGSEWFRKHIYMHAGVIALNPRIQFVGEADPYIKDCMLSVFGMHPSFEVWRWK